MKLGKRVPLWFLAPLLVFAIFIQKPFHIDDSLFLNIGKILPWTVLGDSQGDISFQGKIYENLSPYESTHPPLIPYFLKIVGAGSEPFAPFWRYHLFFLIFPFLALFEGWHIARRKKMNPLWVWFLVFSPVFFVNATNLMTDIAMLSFWMGSIGSIMAFAENGSKKDALKTVVYLLAAFFTSYQSICLIPLLTVYVLVNGQQKRKSMALIILPSLVFLAYLLAVYAISGFFPFLASTIEYNIQSEVMSGMNVSNFLHKTIGVLVFTGLGLAFPTPLLLASLNRRRFLEYVIFASIISFTCFHLADSFHMFEGYTQFELIVFRSLTLIGGIWLFFLLAKLIDGLRILTRNPHRSVNHLLLTFWFFGVLAFNILFLPYATARYLLPAIPAAIILLFIRPRFKVHNVFIYALLFGVASISVLMATVDYHQAKADWALYHDIESRVGSMDHLWYSDDAGLAMYLGGSGAKYLTEKVDHLPVGEYVLLTRGLINQDLLKSLEPLVTYRFPGFWGLSLFNTEGHAGFYCSFEGFMPIAFASEVRRAVLFKVNPFLKQFEKAEKIQLSSPNYVDVRAFYDVDNNLVRGIYMHPDAEIAFPIARSEKAVFSGQVFMPRTSWQKDGDGANFQVGLRREDQVEWVWSRFVDPKPIREDRQRIPFSIDIPAGVEAIHLKVGPGPKSDYRYDSVFWLSLNLSQGAKKK